MSPQELRRKIEEDPEFIAIKRFDFLLSNARARYPDGCPDRIVAQALNMSEEDAVDLYRQIVEKLRLQMK